MPDTPQIPTLTAEDGDIRGLLRGTRRLAQERLDNSSVEVLNWVQLIFQAKDVTMCTMFLRLNILLSLLPCLWQVGGWAGTTAMCTLFAAVMASQLRLAVRCL